MASLRCSAHQTLLRRAGPHAASYRLPSISFGLQCSFGSSTRRLHSVSRTPPRPECVSGTSSNLQSVPRNYSTVEAQGRPKDLPERLAQSEGKGITGSYALYGGTLRIYDSIKTAAAYTISEADRKAERIEKLADGEEVGKSKGPWHKAVGLPATFSTWSQVTMLHIYVIIARGRCLEPDVYQTFYYQLIEHFFHECEIMMDVNHGMSSKGLRQRFLKDLFVQWRGIVAAYDEGLARGDDVLASAVWRNLFKAREDVDLKALAGVVSWMRATLWDLERRTDADVVNGVSLIRVPIQARVDGVASDVLAFEKRAKSKPREGEQA